MRSTRLVPSGSSTFLVRVDQNDNGNIKGTVMGSALMGPTDFSSLTNLVILLEEAMDQMEGMPFEQGMGLRKPTEDFAHDIELEVLFRQNYSWQGKVRLVEEGKEATFRSVLELLIIMEMVYAP